MKKKHSIIYKYESNNIPSLQELIHILNISTINQLTKLKKNNKLIYYEIKQKTEQ